MGWLQFLSAVIDSVAWPATVGLAIFLLRQPLISLIPSLQRLRYKHLDLQFGRQLERLEQELEAKPPTSTPADQRTDPQKIEDERFALLAHVSTGAAIMEAWIDIERRLRFLAEQHQVPVERRRTAVDITKALRMQGVISPRLAQLVGKLDKLRSTSAHSTTEGEISLLSAHRYKEIADEIGGELDLLPKH